MTGDLSEIVLLIRKTANLSENEFRTYDFLLRSGPSTPTTVARETQQSRGRIYETLRSLVERGLAKEQPSRPILYAAVPVTMALSNVMGDSIRQVQSLREAYQEMRTSHPEEQSTAKAGASIRPSDVSVLSGRRSVVAELLRMVGRAQAEFSLAGSSQLALRIAGSQEILQELRSAVLRGVRIRLFFPRQTSAAGVYRSLESELGKDTVIGIAADRVAPHALAAGEGETLSWFAQPDDASPDRGEDVGIFYSGAIFAKSARQRIGLAGEPSTQTSASLHDPIAEDVRT